MVNYSCCGNQAGGLAASAWSRSLMQTGDPMFGLGMPELLIILVIVVVVFGASRLPKIGDGVGQMIANFRKTTKKAAEIKQDGDDEDDKKAQAS